jgi:hypothetical protein
MIQSLLSTDNPINSSDSIRQWIEQRNREVQVDVQLIPFKEKFLWAKDNDPVLYSDLSKLVVRSNFAYTMNPNRLSAYYSANINITKEIGDHISLSFYANNFFNTMRKIHSSQTDLETSLFGSSYVPSYYYGLSLRLKI